MNTPKETWEWEKAREHVMSRTQSGAYDLAEDFVL